MNGIIRLLGIRSHSYNGGYHVSYINIIIYVHYKILRNRTCNERVTIMRKS